MAQVAPEYERLDEFKDIANRIIEKYPSVFGDIDVAKIAAVSIINKDRPDKRQQRVDLKTVTAPLSMFCPIEYLFVLYLSDWAELSEKHRRALVAHALQKISPEGEGKIVSPDMKDYAVILRTLGTDYLENPVIPDILDEDIEWKTSPPYADNIGD